MIHKIAADGMVNAGEESDLQFRADTVRRRNQNRLLQLRKRAIKHSAKAADFGKRSLVERSLSQFLDLVRRARGGVDINSGVAVCDWLGHDLNWDRGRPARNERGARTDFSLKQ